MILITGASGFVGNKLLNSLEGAIPAPSLRGATKEEIKQIMKKHLYPPFEMGAEAKP